MATRFDRLAARLHRVAATTFGNGSASHDDGNGQITPFTAVIDRDVQVLDEVGAIVGRRIEMRWQKAELPRARKGQVVTLDNGESWLLGEVVEDGDHAMGFAVIPYRGA